VPCWAPPSCGVSTGPRRDAAAVTALLEAAVRPLFALFAYLYFFNAMAPEVSPDGSSYHLGLVSRYLLAHAFLSQSPRTCTPTCRKARKCFPVRVRVRGGISAAALVHFAFLAALPFAMMAYGRRFGFSAAGVAGGCFVFLARCGL